jgi:hypothetical protein
MLQLQLHQALDILDARVREAGNERLARLARASNFGERSRTRTVRRDLARVAATVSLGAHSLANKLDECVGADLADQFAGPSRAT